MQFGTRTGLLVEMVRERDATNPRGEQLVAALEEPDAVASLGRLTRVLGAWWQDINPIAQALFAAALTDDAARAAWDDRLSHLRALAGQAVDRLQAARALAVEWSAGAATDWLASQLNPLGWVLLVEQGGWSQATYEERLAGVVKAVLVAEPHRGGAAASREISE